MAYADRNYPRPLKVCVTCSTEYRPTGARQVACAECKGKRRKAMRQKRIPLKIIGCADCGTSIQKNGLQVRCRDCQKKQLAAHTANYRIRHPERAAESNKKTLERHKHKYKERISRANREYRLKNKGKLVAAYRARLQRIRVAMFRHERELIERVYEDRDLINSIFPHVRAHVDHIVPLKNDLVCGLHVVANLRVVRGSENLKKRNKFMENLAA